jgi:hypothetical protein
MGGPVSAHVVQADKLTSQQQQHKLAARALRDDVRLMLQGCKDCWTYKVLHTLSKLGCIQQAAWQPGHDVWCMLPGSCLSM